MRKLFLTVLLCLFSLPALADTVYWYPKTDITSTAEYTPNSGTDHFAVVDDTQGSPDDNSTYLYVLSAATQYEDEYGLDIGGTNTAIPTGATSITVTVYIRSKSSGPLANSAYASAFINSNSNKSYTTEIEPYVSYGGDTWGTQSQEINTDPNTSSAWEAGSGTGINAISLGIKSNGGAGSPGAVRTMWHTQVYLKIDYTPPATPPSGATFTPRVTVF